MKLLARFFVGSLGILLSCRTLGDQFHYNNFLIGDRAIGMGGAYAGVSDDASGIFYNPGGLAYALTNDVSGSANAFYTRRVVYKEAVGGEDFTERSGGSLPSFFGGLQKLDHVARGLVFAFGIYIPDSEQKDQDDTIKNINLGSLGQCPSGAQADRGSLVLDRFHRTVNQRASTFFIGAAAGIRVMRRLSIGIGLNYVGVDELVQEYQDVKQSQAQCGSDGSAIPYTTTRSQNIRQRLAGSGVQPVLGLQMPVMDRLSAGATIKLGTYLAQSFEQTVENRSTGLDADDQAPVDAAEGGTVATTKTSLISQLNSVSVSDKPLGTMPLSARAGLAFFASTRLLMTLDTIYNGAVTDAAQIPGVGTVYDKDGVLDFAFGAEYYMTPSIPLRLGLFTNNDARPKVEENKTGQRDHIDYNGASAFLAWVQPNSQIGLGMIYQLGKGKAQKLADSLVIQDVEAESTTIAFSATHSF
ncbi:MAG: hypothetical protein HYW48_06285 [Deltaproteobacteria bacterium]|nr:hypothetical protein [Deltaproteobacteria bacterium]